MKVSISEIQKLRKLTGVGIIDCKNALLNSNGNIEEAIFFLKKKGEKIALNRSKFETKEGGLIAKVDNNNNYGVIIGINCETDFLSKSTEFIKLLNDLSQKAFFYSSKKEFLNSLYHNNDSVNNILNKKIGIFKEKLDLNTFEKVEAPFVMSYTHNNNKLASIVAFSKKLDYKVAKNITMHVAGMNPVSISEKDFPKSVLKKEIKVFEQQNNQYYKSKDLRDKIIKGKIKKLILENTLLNQKFIKNNNITVFDYLKENSKNSDILSFKRVLM
ncbi:translation elongation factor Ts [Blattabacterium cuenoti]|uniref:translation elongation factor Ts n=1 Tax=Blattabacterium cuenoti TaxID=1653831 RepID=UPI00163BB55D|nr:translation elongation factor Ts [Blattabacterium cuenoti]